MVDTKAESLTYSQAMLDKTAAVIEDADPVGSYSLDFGYVRGQGESIPNAVFLNSKETYLRAGDLSVARLEDPTLNSLQPDFGGPDSPAKMPPSFDSLKSFDTGDSPSYITTQPQVFEDFLYGYNSFIQEFYDAQSRMSNELRETAVNVRLMAGVYTGAEDQTMQDAFDVGLKKS